MTERSLSERLRRALTCLQQLADSLIQQSYSYLYQFADLFAQANSHVQALPEFCTAEAVGSGDAIQILDVCRACWVGNALPTSMLF